MSGFQKFLASVESLDIPVSARIARDLYLVEVDLKTETNNSIFLQIVPGIN